MNRVQELLSEFVELYRIFYPSTLLGQTILELNSGHCHDVAEAVGHVLEREGFNVLQGQHGHHGWLVLDSIAYDTMFPQGYPQSVSAEWLLPEMKLRVGDEVYPLDPYEPRAKKSFTPKLALFYKTWYERHGFEDYRVDLSKTSLKKWRSDYARCLPRIKALYKKACRSEFSGEMLPSGLVKPFTHYHWDCLEETSGYSRTLKPYPFTRSVKEYKFLWKDLRENGTPIERM